MDLSKGDRDTITQFERSSTMIQKYDFNAPNAQYKLKDMFVLVVQDICTYDVESLIVDKYNLLAEFGFEESDEEEFTMLESWGFADLYYNPANDWLISPNAGMLSLLGKEFGLHYDGACVVPLSAFGELATKPTKAESEWQSYRSRTGESWSSYSERLKGLKPSWEV